MNGGATGEKAADKTRDNLDNSNVGLNVEDDLENTKAIRASHDTDTDQQLKKEYKDLRREYERLRKE
jgi:hypothetical protein